MVFVLVDNYCFRCFLCWCSSFSLVSFVFYVFSVVCVSLFPQVIYIISWSKVHQGMGAQCMAKHTWLYYVCPCPSGQFAEWSKGVDSSSTSASCVGSNPTAVRFFIECQHAAGPIQGRMALGALRKGTQHKASRGFELRLLDSESRVLTFTPRGLDAC